MTLRASNIWASVVTQRVKNLPVKMEERGEGAREMKDLERILVLLVSALPDHSLKPNAFISISVLGPIAKLYIFLIKSPIMLRPIKVGVWVTYKWKNPQ